MKVRMKAGLSGTRDGKDWPAVGEVMDLPDDEAASMCASGMAVPVKDDKVETATPPDEDEARADETREALVPDAQAEQKPRRRG